MLALLKILKALVTSLRSGLEEERQEKAMSFRHLAQMLKSGGSGTLQNFYGVRL